MIAKIAVRSNGRNRWNWEIFFSRCSRKSDGRLNVLGFQCWEVCKNFLGRISGSEAGKDSSQCDSGSLENRLASTDLWIAVNSFLIAHKAAFFPPKSVSRCAYAAAFCDAAGGSGCGRARANMAQTHNQLNSASKYAKRKRKTTKTSSPPSVAVLGSSLH